MLKLFKIKEKKITGFFTATLECKLKHQKVLFNSEYFSDSELLTIMCPYCKLNITYRPDLYMYYGADEYHKMKSFSRKSL